MHIDIYKTIKEKASIKKNGVYSYRKYFYLVVDEKLAGYSDYYGNICECAYGFNVSKGKANDRFEARDILKKYLKQITCSK